MMYRGTAPSFILYLIVLYALHATATSTVFTEETGSQSTYAHRSKVLQEKQAYLQHVKELYSTVAEHYGSTMDPTTVVRRLTILGVVSELLSADDSPIRTLMPYIRGSKVLQEESSGYFKVIVTVDPPSKGEQCYQVEGSIDYNSLSGTVARTQSVSCSERPEPWKNLVLSDWNAGGSGVNQYNNGSLGDLESWRFRDF